MSSFQRIWHSGHFTGDAFPSPPIVPLVSGFRCNSLLASPEKTTISPADASSTGFLPIASKTKSSDTLALLTGSPGPALRPIAAPLLRRPERMRPMPRRPMNGSEPMLEIWSYSRGCDKSMVSVLAGDDGHG